MYRSLLLTLAHNMAFKKLFLSCPLTKRVARHFVPGDTWEDARVTIASLLDKGLKASVCYLGDESRRSVRPDTIVTTYLAILDRIDEAGWADQVDISIDLTILGLLTRNGDEVALNNASTIAAKADAIGATVTIGMSNPATITKALKIVHALRQRYPGVGCALQSNLKRTEADARNVGDMRVRLCKGLYPTPAQATYADQRDINLSYVRSLKILMEGESTPLVATHDPILIEITQELAAHTNRGLQDFEFQMMYGVRTVEQERLADLGHTVRVMVPFGRNCYDYVVQRLAGRASNLLLFVRALTNRL